MPTSSSNQGAREVYGSIELQGAVGNDQLNHNQVTVGTESTLIVSARANRRGVLIVQHGTNNVFLGNNGVTTGDGVLLAGTAGTSIFIPTTAAVYGIAGSSQAVSYLEVY